jgi:predicted aspartyl protease
MGMRTGPTGVLTRRKMIGAGAASLALGPAMAQVLPEQPEQLETGLSGANLLTLAVEIDGKGPFHFVVDTGADRSVVADDVAARLNLAAGDPVTLQGVVRTVRANTVCLPKLSTGAVERENITTPVLPRAQLMADGYLGLDILDGYRLTLDFRNSSLAITQPRPAQLIGWAPPNEIPVRVGGDGGHLRSVNCMIDGLRATAFVDTGAEISVGNSLLYRMLSERDPTYFEQSTVPLTGVTGGLIEGRVTTLNKVNLAGLSFEQSRIAIADLQIFRLWEIEDRPSLLIGMNWLRQFSRVSIDYARKELRFDLANRGRHGPMRCDEPGAHEGDCRYLLGSPNTIPRPSVPT